LSQIAGHRDGFKSEEDLKIPADQISELISDRMLSGFHIHTGHSPRSVAYTLRHMKDAGRQTVLNCRIENEAKAPDDWVPLVEAMITQWQCIGAWQWKSLYATWQNSGIPSSYQRNFGEIPKGMKTYVIKAVDALSKDREFLDSSSNPGRVKELLTGAYFHPTAEMWLGPHFWQYAKCTKEEALVADFFIEKRDTPHFLYLKCWPEAFTRPDGEQGRMQQRLWKLFFHEDCEWPPGSGTICDEPMYGPPELMPGYQAPGDA
jgi:hypothetical protein